MLPLQHHHPNTAIVVVATAVAAAAAAAAAASASAFPLLGNNCPNNNYEAAMRVVISSVLQVADAQQRWWGGWSTSVARRRDDNGKKDDTSIAAVALAEYPHLWCAILYSSRGDGSAPLLGSSSGQYTSLFRSLTVVGDGLYHSSGGSGNHLRDGQQAFAMAMNATLQGLSCYASINIKERR
jgi:hypothetical protein